MVLRTFQMVPIALRAFQCVQRSRWLQGRKAIDETHKAPIRELYAVYMGGCFYSATVAAETCERASDFLRMKQYAA